MKKAISFIVLFLCVATSLYAQPIVRRAGQANTVSDYNLQASRSFFLPRYADTTAANTVTSLDTCGKLISTFDNRFWIRSCDPKRWDEVGANTNSISDITITNDSTVIICSGANVCDTFTFQNIVISYTYLLNDSTLVACDSLQVCDTISIPPQLVYIFQNGLTQPATGITEFGGSLIHNTSLNTNYSILTFEGKSIYEFPVQFQQQVDFANSTGVASFLSRGSAPAAPQLDYLNQVRLGVNYTSSVYPGIPDNLEGYFGDRIGYFLSTNLTGHGSFGQYVDNELSKSSGLFFHTLDTAYTDAFTMFAIPSSAYTGPAPFTLGIGNMADYKVLTGHTTRDIQLWNYPSSRDDGELTKVLGTDADGNVILGTVSGIGGTNIYNSNGSLSGNRRVSGAGFDLMFDSLSKTDFRTYDGSAMKMAAIDGTDSSYISLQQSGIASVIELTTAVTDYVNSITINPTLGVFGTSINQSTDRTADFLLDGSAGYARLRATSTSENLGAELTVNYYGIYAETDSVWYAGSDQLQNPNTFIKIVVPDSTITISGSGSGEGLLFLKVNDYTNATNGQVLSLKDNSTGETEWITASGGSTDNQNIGSGFRWLKPAGQEIKTFFTSIDMVIDSSTNTNGLTIGFNAAIQALTDGATITWDYTPNAAVTLGGDRTLSITNTPAGRYGTLKITQDGSGGHTLAVPDGEVTLDETAGAITIVGFFYDGSTYYWNGGYQNPIIDIYRTAGIDSIYGVHANGDTTAILDSTGGGGSSYTFSTGLTEATGTVTNNLSTGVSGGQTLIFGTGSGDDGTFSTTPDGTKGDFIFGTKSKMWFDEQNTELHLGSSTDQGLYQLQVHGASIFGAGATDAEMVFTNSSSTTGSSTMKIQQFNGTEIGRFVGYDASFVGTYGGIALASTFRMSAAFPANLTLTTNTSDIYLIPNNTYPAITVKGTGLVGIKNVSPSALLTIGLAGTYAGTFSSAGSTSGTITFQPQAAAGTYNWNWPTTAGSSGELLTSGGGSSTAMNWTSISSGLSLSSNALRSKTYSLTTNTTNVGNVGTGEDNLMTYTIPAGQLSTNGDYLEFTMEIGYAANTDGKVVKVYYGASNILTLASVTSGIGGTVTITGTIIRTGAATQKISVTYNSNVTGLESGSGYAETAETLSGTVVLKATGEATSNDDIQQRILNTKYFSN